MITRRRRSITVTPAGPSEDTVRARSQALSSKDRPDQVTELRRNGNTMVERTTIQRRVPAPRLPGQPSQTQPHTIASPAAVPYRPVHGKSHHGHCGPFVPVEHHHHKGTPMTTIAQSSDPVAALKLAHRATWAAGDYPAVARHIADDPVRDALTAARVRPGARVLDVATGSGNVALHAANAGAQVVGLDLVPELLDVAHSRALAAGVEIEWVHGDAEALPFADGSFDSVTSVFGVQFAPRHQTTADELVRVCRAGGTIGLINWTPEGLIGEMFQIMGRYLPPPPAFATAPPLWGDEHHVREPVRPPRRDTVVHTRVEPVRVRERRRLPDVLRAALRSDHQGAGEAACQRAAGTTAAPNFASCSSAGTRQPTAAAASRPSTSRSQSAARAPDIDTTGLPTPPPPTHPAEPLRRPGLVPGRPNGSWPRPTVRPGPVPVVYHPKTGSNGSVLAGGVAGVWSDHNHDSRDVTGREC